MIEQFKGLKTKIAEILPFSCDKQEQKGWRGVVFKARAEDGRILCLKTLRGKVPGTSLKKEYEALLTANGRGIGPTAYEYDPEGETVAMEFIEGELFLDWIMFANAEEIKRTVPEILRQGYELDQLGIDHGQLSWAPKHVIISKERTTLIDFDRASTERKARNLTSLTAFLLLNPRSLYAQRICRVYGLGSAELEKIKGLMQKYRQESNGEKYYLELLSVLSAKPRQPLPDSLQATTHPR